MIGDRSLAADRRQRRMLLAQIACAVAVAMFLLGHQLWSSYTEAMREGATKTQNYAAIIEARLDATLRRTESALQTLIRDVPAEAMTQAAAANFRPRVTENLDGQMINFVELAGLRVYDADGSLLYASASERQPRASIADRAYFLQVRDDAQAGLVFSEVVPITAIGRPGVVAARAIRDARGAFIGVVLAVIDLDYFTRLFQSLDIGPAGVLVIRRSDDYSGVVRWPYLEREINRPLPPTNPVRQAMQAGKPVSTLDYPASSDGVVRTYSYRSVQGYPFFVLAALAHDDVLAGWRARSLAVGAAGLLVLVLLAGLMARLWRIESGEARAMAALAGSEERLRLALAASNQGLYDLDLRTGNATVNEEYARMLGHDPAQFRETNAAWIERLHPDDAERVSKVYRDYVSGATSDYRVEFRQRLRDGGYKWILSIGRIVERDAQGQPLRMLGTHLDIDDRKHAEQALKNLNAELEARVTQRTAELVRARDDAERANRAKSDFLSAMSHELRTPMNAILGFGQLLEIDAKQQPPSKQKFYVREILNAGQHLLELIDDLLDLARIEAGRQPIRLVPVQINGLIHECLSLVEPIAREHDVRSSAVEPIPDWRVSADRTRLRQVLLNLLSNSIKYNRKGGSVRVACTDDGDCVRISVADTGCGISTEHQERMFNWYERLGADRTSIQGAGIGLMLSKRLVEMMNGQIGLDSEVDVGSTFWIRLPRATAAQGGDATKPIVVLPDIDAASADAEHTVLYIEDDAANVALMEAVFADQPAVRLITAPLPGLGLDMARTQRPSLILLDIELPGMDGYQVLQRLREVPATADIPVIAISANAMASDVERGRAAGFVDYLTKPFDVPRLVAMIRKTLRLTDLS